MEQFLFSLYTVNSDTVLSRVIETVKRRRIPIQKLVAMVCPADAETGRIELVFIADEDRTRLLKTQLEKLVDVIEVSFIQQKS